MKKVKVIFPDGSVGEVDEKDLQAALDAGAKRYTAQEPKMVKVEFADGSKGEIAQSDYDQALAAGAVKKKETGGDVSETGTQSTAPFSLQSISATAAGSGTISGPAQAKNPYAGILQATAKANIPEDQKKIIYDEAVINKNLDPLVNLVTEEKRKLNEKKKQHYDAIKPEPDLTGTSDLILATQTPKETNEFQDDDNRITAIQKDAANAINSIFSTQLLQEGIKNGNVKKMGEQRRKFLSAIGEDFSYNDQLGYLEEQRKLNSRTKFGYKINKERNQQEFEYLNERGMYEQVLPELEDELNALAESDTVKRFVNGSVDERKALRNNPEILDFIQKNNDYLTMRDHYQKLALNYPEVSRQLDRQNVADKWADIVQAERTMASLTDLTDVTKGRAIFRQLRNLFVGEKPDTEDEYKQLSSVTGLPIDRVKEMVKTSQVTNPIGVPSKLGSAWRAAHNILRSSAQGINRVIFDKDAANLINKEIQQDIYQRPDALRKNWNVDRVFDTMADAFGQFVGYAALSGGLGTLPKAGTAVLESQIPARAIGAGEGLLTAMNKATNVATTFGVGYMSSLEDAYQYASSQTDDELKRWEYANAVAIANGASELILRDVDVAEKILKGKSPAKIINELNSLRTPFSSKDIFKARMAELARVVGYESAEEVIPYVTEVLAKNNIFGQKTSTSEFMQGLFDTVVETAIGTIPIGAASAGRVNSSSNLTKSALFEAGKTPGYFTSKFRDMFENGQINEDQMNRNIKTVNTLAEIYKSVPDELNNKKYTETEKADLVSKIFALRLLKESEDSIDESLKPFLDKDKKNIQDNISDIVEHGVTEPAQTISDEDKSLFSRAYESASAGVKLLIGEQASDEGITALQQQAVDAPNSLLSGLNNNRDVVTDAIARNSVEEINKSIDKFSQRIADLPDTLTDEQHDEITKEIDQNISLLEEGLEKKNLQISGNEVKPGNLNEIIYDEALFSQPLSEDNSNKTVKLPSLNNDGTTSETEMKAETARQHLNGQLNILDLLIKCLS